MTDTGTSLTYVADTIAELVDRVADLEEKLERLAADVERSGTPPSGVTSDPGEPAGHKVDAEVEEVDEHLEGQGP